MNTLLARSVNRASRGLSSKSWTVTPTNHMTRTHPSPAAPSSITFTRPFSALNPNTNQPPSAIERAALPLLTPGHAISILSKHGAGSRHALRTSDVQLLLTSARPGKKRDAYAIVRALSDFRRCNKYILTKKGGRAALEGIVRAMTPNYKVVYGIHKVRAGGYALGSITEETGLYYTVDVWMMDKILRGIQEGVEEMISRGCNVRVDLSGEDEKEEKDGGYELSDRQTLKSTLESINSSMNLMIKRRARPENDMKKRAKRAYLKYLKTNEGPSVSTMELATDICIKLGGVEYAKENIVEPYRRVWWSRGVVDESVLGLIEAEEKRVEEEAAAAAAAAAELEALEENEDAEQGEDDAVNEADGEAKEGEEETK